MFPLLLNLVIVSFICLLYLATPDKNRIITSIFLFATFACLLFVHSMMDIDSLPDLEIYDLDFYEIKRLTFKECFIKGELDGKTEIGYVILNKLISFITNDFRGFLWIYSFIMLFMYYKFFTSASPYIALSIMLLLVGPFNQSLFVLRQHLAVALMLPSFTLIRDRKCIKFLIVLFFAFYLHRSALVFLPVYFLYGLSNKNLVKSFIVITILSVILFGIVLSYFADLFAVYENYMDVDTDNPINYKTAMVAGLYLFIYILFLKDHVFDEGINRFSFIMLFMYCIFSIAGIGSIGVIGRLSVYFSVGVLTAIPIILTYIRETWMKIIVFFVVFAIQFYMCFIGSQAQYIANYQII